MGGFILSLEGATNRGGDKQVCHPKLEEGGQGKFCLLDAFPPKRQDKNLIPIPKNAVPHKAFTESVIFCRFRQYHLADDVQIKPHMTAQITRRAPVSSDRRSHRGADA